MKTKTPIVMCPKCSKGGHCHYQHERRVCCYCWRPFLVPSSNARTTCSDLCSTRTSSWNTWIRQTSTALTMGDVQDPVHLTSTPAGASLFQSVSRFATSSDVTSNTQRKEDTMPRKTSTTKAAAPAAPAAPRRQRAPKPPTPSPLDEVKARLADPETHAVAVVDLLNLCRPEVEAVKEAKRTGAAKPDTPATDFINSPEYSQDKAQAAFRQARGATRRTARPTAPEGSTWTYNGHPIERTGGYGLSQLAQEHSKGILGTPGPMSVDEFRDYLVAEHGITEPLTTSWDVTLSNGHRVGLTQPGDELPTPGELSAAQKAIATRRARKAQAATVALAAAPEKPKRQRTASVKPATTTKRTGTDEVTTLPKTSTRARRAARGTSSKVAKAAARKSA